MPWKPDLEFGEECEREIAEFLAGDDQKVEHSVGNFSDWDYKIDGKTYEQKTDRKTIFTGNIVVELTEDGKPAGILRSKADYWVSYPIEYGEIAVVPRMKMARITRDKHVKVLDCGDTVVGTCMLVPWLSIPKKYKMKYRKSPVCLL